MPRHTALVFALATLSATAAVSFAQIASPAAPQSSQISSQTMQANPAPIVRDGANTSAASTYTTTLAAGQTLAPTAGPVSAQPNAGIFVRVGDQSSVRAIAVDPQNTELSVQHGVANISVHEPVAHAQILIDLPGGQTALVKDGFYTFNADTNTVRVLKGEAFAYPGTKTDSKSIKIKEDHAVVLAGPRIKAFAFDPFEARADLIPYPAGSGMPGNSNYAEDSGGYGNAGGYDGGDYGYGGGGYGMGFGGYPYGGLGFGFYDSPFGYSPFGLGFYGGGFYGGGLYGGYGGYGGGYDRDGDFDGDGYGGRGYGGRGGRGGRGPRAGGGGGGGAFHGGSALQSGKGGGPAGGSGAGGSHGGPSAAGGGAAGGFHGGGGGGFGGGGHAGGGGGHR